MRKIAIVAWAAVAALVVAVGIAWMSGLLPKPAGKLPFTAQIGAPFTLTDHNGKSFSSENLKGKPFALFFGFTFCPDVCPTSLLEMTKDIEALGKAADRMNYIFVTVDPERDKPEHLKTYMENFDARIVGLTGTPEQIAELARAYRVYYEKVKTEDGYTVNHTATTFLMGRDGELVSTLAYGEKTEMRRRKLRNLVDAGG